MKYLDVLYNKLAAVNYHLKNRRRVRGLFEPWPLMVRSLLLAIEDAKEYLGISTESFFEYANLWKETEEKLFDQRSTDFFSFYEGWVGKSAHYNICANILNQHLDMTSFKAMYNFLLDPRADTIFVDYGCGTASLTISFLRDRLIGGKVVLLDVNNDVKDFMFFRIKKYKLGASIEWQDVVSYSRNNFCDYLMCIDVLEHLQDASDVFSRRIHPLLKVDGLLYLKAPWRGQRTHFDAAPEDFYSNGGRMLLGRKYKLLCRLIPMDIAGVYKKLGP